MDVASKGVAIIDGSEKIFISMSRGNLISSFVLGLACGFVALPASARADRDAPASADGKSPGKSPGMSAGSKGAAGAAPAAGPAAPGLAPASPSPRTGTAANATERVHLAAELRRINAEIDALKRSPRGIRDDYNLRNRMADAEAVARRLTELEAQGGPVRTPEGAPGASLAWPSEVPVGAGDDSADLEAKADILTDEARRLAGEANRIETRMLDLRARRELRRRAGQLERDPFSPLEQAKSRVVTGATGASQATSGSKSPPPRTSGGTSLGAEGTSSGAPAAPTAGPTGMSAGASDSAGGSPPPTTNNNFSGTASPLSTGVLDPNLLTEVRRLEASSAPSANLTALETAVAALRTRSTELAQRAAALRARAAQRAY